MAVDWIINCSMAPNRRATRRLTHDWAEGQVAKWLRSCRPIPFIAANRTQPSKPSSLNPAVRSHCILAPRLGREGETNLDDRGKLTRDVSEQVLRNGENHDLLVLAKALPGASGSLALERMQKKIAAAATGGILSSLGKQNGNSGQYTMEGAGRYE